MERAPRKERQAETREVVAKAVICDADRPTGSVPFRGSIIDEEAKCACKEHGGTVGEKVTQREGSQKIEM